MKRQLIIGSILMIMLIGVFNFFTIDVKGITSDIIASNFDDVASGLDSGTSGYISFKNMGTINTFETSTDYDLSSANSFKVGVGGTGYWNLTSSFSYIGEINFSVYFYDPSSFAGVDMFFYDSSNNRVMDLHFQAQNPGYDWVSWQDVSAGEKYIVNHPSGGMDNQRFYVVIKHLSTNLFNITVFNATFVQKGSIQYAGSYAGNYTTFDHIFFTGYAGTVVQFYFDNFKINTEKHIPIENNNPNMNTFNLRFFDITTNKQMLYIGKENSAYIFPMPLTTEYFYSTILSNDDLWVGDYKPDSYGTVYPITANFTEGNSYTFHLSNTTSSLSNFPYYLGTTKGYMRYKNFTLQLYAGQTYDIFLYPTWYIDGVEYSNCGIDRTMSGAYVCTNKDTYDIGETLRLQYLMPTGSWLYDNNYGLTGYRLKVYNTENYFLGMRLTGLIKTPHVIEYTQADGDIIFDGNRHTLEIPITEDINEYGFKNHYAKYEIVVETYDYGIFQGWQIVTNCDFFVTGEDFVPTGTITSLTPNPCYIGQSVTFAWASNGVGHIDMLSPDGKNIIFSIPYGYSDGVHTFTKTISTIGNLAIRLYTDSNLVNVTLPVDTDTLICNPLGENGTYGSYGYGTPYLYIPMYRGIAGYDTIYIYYRTYKNDSLLEIKSPRDETTYFSTTVSNTSDNVLAIEIPSYMQIGTWNVTLYGGDINGTSKILRTTFNIVNEEYNWIEFTKHQFTTDDALAVYIKHSYRVSLTFYKDNVAQGENIILNIGEQDNTEYVIPISIIPVSAGNWRVEMWRINDRNIIYELAEWNCIVVQGTNKNIVDVGGFFGIVIPPIFLIIIGIIVTLIITMCPFLIGFALSKGRIEVKIPPLLYIAFFFFGLVVSVIFGFLPIILPFIVLLGLVVGFAIMWLRGQSATGE